MRGGQKDPGADPGGPLPKQSAAQEIGDRDGADGRQGRGKPSGPLGDSTPEERKNTDQPEIKWRLVGINLAVELWDQGVPSFHGLLGDQGESWLVR